MLGGALRSQPILLLGRSTPPRALGTRRHHLGGHPASTPRPHRCVEACRCERVGGWSWCASSLSSSCSFPSWPSPMAGARTPTGATMTGGTAAITATAEGVDLRRNAGPSWMTLPPRHQPRPAGRQGSRMPECPSPGQPRQRSLLPARPSLLQSPLPLTLRLRQPQHSPREMARPGASASFSWRLAWRGSSISSARGRRAEPATGRGKASPRWPRPLLPLLSPS